MPNINQLHAEMLKSVDESINGEQFIRNFYKFPLGLLVIDDPQAANAMYDHVMKQIPDEKSREFDVYYDCWLYLYAKLANNPNSKLHYGIIARNKTVTGGFSALQDGDPELRATAISMICAFFEKDTNTVKKAAEFIVRLYELNKRQDNFYFMTDKKYNLIKNFFIERERVHVFKTKKARPLLYSFSLAVIALLSAHMLTRDSQYLKLAHKYAQLIIQNDFKNNYCGKSLVAMGMMHEITKQRKYLKMADSLEQYIAQLTITVDTTPAELTNYKQSGQLFPVDRLSEYSIALKFYDSAKEGISFLKNYLQDDAV